MQLKEVYYDCENCIDKDNCKYKDLELIKDRYCFHPEMISD